MRRMKGVRFDDQCGNHRRGIYDGRVEGWPWEGTGIQNKLWESSFDSLRLLGLCVMILLSSRSHDEGDRWIDSNNTLEKLIHPPPSSSSLSPHSLCLSFSLSNFVISLSPRLDFYFSHFFLFIKYFLIYRSRFYI